VSARLAAYFERIGLGGAPSADPAGLETIQRAHRLAIPFENLDVRLGRPIAVDGEGVFAKLVVGRRGGYCFEHNRLLADVLAELGIHTRPLLARVRVGQPVGSQPPRTHILLLAELAGGRWLADAGFGGSYVPVLPLADGAEAEAPDGARHRLRRIGGPGRLAGEWLLERAPKEGDWQPQYTFDLAEVGRADIEQANHWTSTAPETRFTTLHIVTRPLPDGFASLVDRTLSVSRGADVEIREISDRPAYSKVLRDIFALDLPEADLVRLPLFLDETGCAGQ
jgi:arylamine N-acetyltransferase